MIVLKEIYTICGRVNEHEFYAAMIVWMNANYWGIVYPFPLLFLNVWLEASKN